MSSSWAEPALSVVIGSTGRAKSLEACLAALEPQREGIEVLVCEAEASSPGLRERFAWAQFHVRAGELVPELWSDGISRSQGRAIALTIGQMIPASNWIETLRTELSRREVVGGAIDPGPDLRLTDWAEYFCRYVRDMLPFHGHECLDLPGDNAAYRREALERTEELFREGFWEPVVHRKLAADGAMLWHSPDLIVRQGRSAGWSAFARQRLVHGRAHGRQRSARFGTARILAGIVGAPLVPPLLSMRILREVMGKRRYRVRALLALPMIVSFNVAWAIGEARGHVDALRG
ncbi:MAG TPA: hypothetical protein VE693_08125 [Gaiellaceae bacterium]|jgi:hypothetical protein|nr:hypothetical protein [Gaiellaceae bacterium]